MPSTLEHVGIAVTGDALERLLAGLVGLEVYKSETVAAQGVETRFADAGAKLEYLVATSPGSPVARFLEKRGPGVHHLAFRVDDLDAALGRARAAGVEVLGAPSDGADGLRIAFLHPRDTHGVLVELCEPRPDALPPTESIETPAGAVAAHRWPSRAVAPPLVLLHGAGASTRLETAHLARLLQPSREVVALDLPGHGASEHHETLSFDGFVGGVAGVLGALDGPVDLFGFSLGGAVALSVAERVPQAVGCLAVCGVATRWDAPLVARMLARLDADAIAERTPAGWHRLDAAHRGNARGVLASLHPFVRALARRDLTARPPHPTLVLTGSRDELFGLEPALTLARDLPSADLGVVPGVGHRLGADEADAVAPLLRRFLDG